MVKNSVVLVPFPFDDFSDSKVRPAVCLTNQTGKYESVVIAFISSRIPKELLESDLLIKMDSDNWEGTGLSVDSVIRLHKIVSVPVSIIKRKLGSVNQAMQNEIKAKILKLFEYEE